MAQAQLTCLAVDDDAGDAEILRRHLAEVSRDGVEFIHATSIDAAQAELLRPGVELIIVDNNLGAESGQDLIKAIRASGDLRPIIVLSGHGDESVAAAAMRAGADDYLAKCDLDTANIRRAIDNSRAQFVRRKMVAKNRQLLEELQLAKARLEGQNRHLAKMYEAAHQFVDHVSHEFRTPLTVIREFASIINDGLAGDTTREQREYAEIIIGRVGDLANLIDDMLDISKLEAGMLGIRRQDCRVEEIIERVREMLTLRAASSRAQLTISVPPDIPPVYCDPEKAGRVLINLVTNALKFSGDEGRIGVAVRADAAAGEAIIDVTDNGPGIAPETVKSLFQRFRQVAGTARAGIKGFGLGLSIAKELAQLNLGELSVTSQVGQGSTFSFSVPYASRRELIARYLARAKTLCEDASTVTMLEVACDRNASAKSLDAIARLAEKWTRRSDLLLRVRPHCWLLVVTGNATDAGAIIARLEQAHAEATRNHVGEPLPPLSASNLGQWRIDQERELVTEEFVSRSQA